MRYSPTEVHVDPRQEDTLKNAIAKKKQCSVRIFLIEPEKKTLLLTKGQIERLERAKLMGKDQVSITLSVPQVKANTEHTGGFLWGLASTLGPLLLQGAKALGPALLRGAASAVAAKGMEKMMGKGMYFQKNGHCSQVQAVKGGGLYLSPHPRIHGGEGLFEAENGVVGGGLLLGENSPFKNVPLLNILL